MPRINWFEDRIEQFIKDNSNKGLVEIVDHFGKHFGIDQVFDSLAQLEIDCKIKRTHVNDKDFHYMPVVTQREHSLSREFSH
jgi:hypothetical protein